MEVISSCCCAKSLGLTGRTIHKSTTHTMAVFVGFLTDKPLLEIKNFIFLPALPVIYLGQI